MTPDQIDYGHAQGGTDISENVSDISGCLGFRDRDYRIAVGANQVGSPLSGFGLGAPSWWVDQQGEGNGEDSDHAEQAKDIEIGNHGGLTRYLPGKF